MFQETNFNDIEKKCRVNTRELLLYPPIALSMGEVTLRTKSGKKTYPILMETLVLFQHLLKLTRHILLVY